LPGLTYVEPAYGAEVDWLLCDALNQLSQPDGEATYLRLSTRPIDHAPFQAVLDRYGEEPLRAMVLQGGYRLRDAPQSQRPGVTLVTTGVMAPEALAAADELDAEGVDAAVVHLTSPDRAYRSWRQTFGSAVISGEMLAAPSHLHRLVPPAERSRPIVSVHDAASHALAWVGSALGTHQLALGVDRFGESGTIDDLHHLTGISTGNIVNAALIALDRQSQ